MAGGTPSLGLLPHFVCVCALIILPSSQVIGTELTKNMVKEWAIRIGKEAYEFTKNITGGEQLQKSYEVLNVSTREVEWRPLLSWTKLSMEDYFHKKIKALKNIVRKAEDAYCKHVIKKEIKYSDVDYPNSKKLDPYLNKTGIHLVQSSIFKTAVTFNRSILHVPTDVYDGSWTILNGMKWSDTLNEVFVKNRKEDPTVSWQYFGSDDGFMRIYPGYKWKHTGSPVDLYDARSRSWYIQGATSPKDVIIAIDASGSMRGVPMRIAKLSAQAMIDTFEDNDFFNVVYFNLAAEVLLCKDNKLIQATKKNKEIAKKLLDGIKDGNMAHWNDGFNLAFDLLDAAMKDKQGSQCQQVIMVFSDGTTYSLKELFKKRNPTKRVRVFTYPVGPPAESTTAMLKMSRQNRGYFSRVQSVGAVRSVSESYIRVLSRPMAMAPSANTTESTIWTGVYLDALGLGMMVTGVLPVFYRPTINMNCSKSQKSSTDTLLGVAGTDVPLVNLNEFILQPLIGANGYGFGINNNGLIAFHPRLKTVYGYLPDDPGVDIMDAEIPLNRADLMQLRNAMINRTFSNTKADPQSAMFDVLDVSKDELRVTKRKYHFYFDSLQQTSFSIGIATPNIGFKYNSKNKTGLISKLQVLLKASDIQLEKWPYCPENRTSTNPVQDLILNNLNQNPNGCNDDMLTGLAVDLEATSDMTTLWKNKTASYILKNIKSVFARTHYGVTRSLSLSGDGKGFLPSLADFGRVTSPEVNNNNITYSAPFRAVKKVENSTTVMAYQKLMYSNRPVAVAGFEMEESSFANLVFEETKKCMTGNCADVNCDRHGKNQHEGLYCYLLDENAFVVASNDKESSGLFFGNVDNSVMELLIKLQGNITTGIYNKVVFTDIQAVCENKPGTGSSGTSLLSPLFTLSSYVEWWRSKAIWFFMYFNVYSWLYSENKPFAEASEEKPKNQSCIKDITTYYAEKGDVLENGTAHCTAGSGGCSRNFMVSNVPHSNLYLVVVDAKCGQCYDNYVKLDIPGKAKKIDIVDNDALCNTATYRKRPKRCFETEDPESGYPAGHGNAVSPSIAVLVGMLLLASSLLWNST